MICNHSSWLDSFLLLSHYSLAFALDAGFKKHPLMGPVSSAIDSIFIPRAGTPEDREKVIEVIKERQEIIETTGKYN